MKDFYFIKRRIRSYYQEYKPYAFCTSEEELKEFLEDLRTEEGEKVVAKFERINDVLERAEFKDDGFYWEIDKIDIQFGWYEIID